MTGLGSSTGGHSTGGFTGGSTNGGSTNGGSTNGGFTNVGSTGGHSTGGFTGGSTNGGFTGGHSSGGGSDNGYCTGGWDSCVKDILSESPCSGSGGKTLCGGGSTGQSDFPKDDKEFPQGCGGICTNDNPCDKPHTPAPEPATFILFGLGGLGLVGYTRRRKHNSR